VETGVEKAVLERVIDAVSGVPEGFTLHPKLVKLVEGRRKAFESGTVDWALAESLAFGSLVLGGVPVRVAGQDSRRGTFSQRHSVLVDYKTEEEYVPLAVLGRGAAPFRIYDSLLSEYAALGFEYGYSVSYPGALVAWEAQFGDFVNGAQIIIDQFIVAAEDKWGQHSCLTLLLPHGFEGQGPEHSSARLERFLALGANDNIRVAYPTTSAQYFHLLRRQALASPARPLVVMTPKRYLRVPVTRSPVDELVSGRFAEVLVDRPAEGEPERVVFCTGKVGHELIARRDEKGLPATVVRLEQLYPFPKDAIQEVVDDHSGAQLYWVQEEPENMGALALFRRQMVKLLGDKAHFEVVTRPEQGSPATGTATAHEAEQERILEGAFNGLK
jgi:2-oxoglutarate dehydrogenase E1 component